MNADGLEAAAQPFLAYGDRDGKVQGRVWARVLTLAVGAALGVFATAAFVLLPSPLESSLQLHEMTPASSARLRVRNGCESDPLWIANFALALGAPLYDTIKLEAGSSHEFNVPEEGMSTIRFWAKWGCDAAGSACAIGQSAGPGQLCADCAPPIDSRLDISFGCLHGADKCAANPAVPSETIGSTDSWRAAHLDGFTLPYKIELTGHCPGVPSKIDCSSLALSECPDEENVNLPSGPVSLLLATRGSIQAAAEVPSAMTSAAGCFAPCAKLTYLRRHNGLAYEPESQEAQDFCCPTPPIEPEACATGPVAQTSYVRAVHEMCPHASAFAFDKGSGLACPAGVRYDVTFFCPR